MLGYGKVPCVHMMFNVDIKSLDDFIYKHKASPSIKISFTKLSSIAHISHNSINRRYRKFMAFKRDSQIDINKTRAKRCCRMVKKHLEDLKEVREYMYQNQLDQQHPIFCNKIDKWIEQCNNIYMRYKKHIKDL